MLHPRTRVKVDQEQRQVVARRIIHPAIHKIELPLGFSVERAPLELVNDTVECGVVMSCHDHGRLARE